jgi:hypothetical protein
VYPLYGCRKTGRNWVGVHNLRLNQGKTCSSLRNTIQRGVRQGCTTFTLAFEKEKDFLSLKVVNQACSLRQITIRTKQWGQERLWTVPEGMRLKSVILFAGPCMRWAINHVRRAKNNPELNPNIRSPRLSHINEDFRCLTAFKTAEKHKTGEIYCTNHGQFSKIRGLEVATQISLHDDKNW